MAKVTEKIFHDTKKTIEDTKKKILDTHKKINELEYDAHWYRRVFHAFGASFLLYYYLPEEEWIIFLKFWIPLIIVVIAIILEILRIKGFVSSNHFFGLRMYEKNRIGSYVFFAVAILLLLKFFPQPIAIPCILCACLGDPLIGEIRFRYGINYVYVLGFLICMSFFLIAWYKADLILAVSAGIVGGLGALIGETNKFWWLDDDFMIQILPAILVGIIWIALPYIGYSDPGSNFDIINPAIWPW
jgi:dolichol kinase